jgi:hypothetical protein
MHMANDSLFIHVASILWAASISPPIGKPNIPDAFKDAKGAGILMYALWLIFYPLKECLLF